MDSIVDDCIWLVSNSMKKVKTIWNITLMCRKHSGKRAIDQPESATFNTMFERLLTVVEALQ